MLTVIIVAIVMMIIGPPIIAMIKRKKTPGQAFREIKVKFIYIWQQDKKIIGDKVKVIWFKKIHLGEKIAMIFALLYNIINKGK